MDITQFEYAKSKIDEMMFYCSKKEAEIFKSLLSRVFDRMNEYFLKNNLYDSASLDLTLERMRKRYSNFYFTTDEHLNGKAGFRKTNGTNIIAFDPEILEDTISAESKLCHEILHYMTLGPDYIEYEKNGRIMQNFCLKDNFGKVKKSYIKDFETGKTFEMGKSCLAKNKAMYEGMTELFKQQIYSPKECGGVYTPFVQMTGLLFNLTGGKINYEDFLRSNMTNLLDKLGVDTYKDVQELYSTAFDRYSHVVKYNIYEDEYFIKLQDVIVNKCLNNVIKNPNKFSLDEISIMYENVKNNLPCPNRDYDKLLGAVVEKFSKTLINENLKENEARILLKEYLETNALNCKNKIAFNLGEEKFEVSRKDRDWNFRVNNLPNIIIRKKDNAYLMETIKKEFFNIEPKVFKNGDVRLNLKSFDGNDYFDLSVLLKEGGLVEIENVNDNSKKTINYNFALSKNKYNVESEKGILNNTENIIDVKNILKSENNIRKIRKIKLQGENVFVADLEDSTKFFVLDENGKIQEQKVISKQRMDNEEFVVKRVEKKGKTYLKQTDEVIDDSSVLYELENGENLVRYYHNAKENYASEFFNIESDDLNYIKEDSQLIFDKSNKNTKNIFDFEKENEDENENQEEIKFAK